MFKNLTFERLLKTLLFAGGAVIVGMVLFNFSNLIAYALIALIFSYILDPVVNRLHVAGMHRTLAISLVLATVLITVVRSEDHTSELQSRGLLICRLLLETKKTFRSRIPFCVVMTF